MRIVFVPTKLAALDGLGRQRDSISRDWPHVPRVGDAVSLIEPDVVGVVVSVEWLDGASDRPAAVVRLA